MLETTRTVTINSRTFPYHVWDGQRLQLQPQCPYLAFDTETDVVDLTKEVPGLAMVCVSTGKEHLCIHPGQVADFVRLHSHAHFIFHNVAFDFWVVDQHLLETGRDAARQLWWNMCHQDQLHDSMLLDILIRLAEGKTTGDQVPPRNLAVVAEDYTALRISKDDPYRQRYGEIIGKPWDEIEDGFFEYAIKDPIVTYRAYMNMMDVAERIMIEHGYDPGQKLDAPHDIRPDAIEKFGRLSEQIQVKGAIALAQVTRNGLHLDTGRIQDLKAQYLGQVNAITDRLVQEYPGIIKTDDDGNIIRNNKSQTPSINQETLRSYLVKAAAEAENQTGIGIDIPRTPKGSVSTSAKEWAKHADKHPLFQLWADREKVSKQCEFFNNLQGEVVHPRYNTMLRTGRTSCSNPNIQQIPRDGGFRELFIPSPGHLLLAIDYSYIELRTLAAVCEGRYGKSKLADTIRKGIDPHCFTAAMLLGMELDSFMALKQIEDEVEQDGDTKRIKGYRFKRHRQNAKAVNFGVPGGLGVKSLVDYARNTYRVDMSQKQAEEKRRKLITEVYPELNEEDGYLADDGMARLAKNLNAREDACWQAFDWKGTRNKSMVRPIQKIVIGNTTKADGDPYDAGFVDRTWDSLNDLNRNGDPRLAELLEMRQPGKELYDLLFRQDVAIPTGRIRGNVEYTQSKNTPFQSLAADGAKLALWDLLYNGYRVVGFVHDEILIELKDQGGHADHTICENISRIICDAMAEVTGNIPIDAEYAVSRCWSKEAQKIVKDTKVLPWQR